MSFRPSLRRLLGPCAAALSLALAGHTLAAEPEPSAISPAEQLLFLDEHLAGLKAPATLRYRYTDQTGSQPAAVTDEVLIRLERGERGTCCTASGRYLSGERELRLPAMPDVKANPVLLYFLEQQVRQLQQETKGQSAHFRRRIRLVLADSAKVENTTIAWAGREVKAQRVRISPYLDDPQRHRFEKQAQAIYTFVLSPEVPGGIYQLDMASAPGEDARHQTLTLQPTAATR